MHIHSDTSASTSARPAAPRVHRRPGELTAAQHAAIRQQLVLLPVYIWLVYMWWMFFIQLPVGQAATSEHAVRDFVHFYTQGVITREHDARALYDIDAMAAVVDRVVPVAVDVRFPPVYGPQVGLVFSPLASLGYLHALLLWLSLTVVGSAGCAVLVWQTCPFLARRRWAVTVLSMAAPGLHFALSFGQVSVIGLLCLTALWRALRAERPFLAGLAVGALAYKPQLGVVAACIFIWRRDWRIVIGASLAVAAQALAALAYWGPTIFAGYLKALTALPQVITGMEPDKSLMHSWRGLFLHVGLSPHAALVLTVALSLATIVLAVRCWTTSGDLRLRFALLVLATLLVDSHLYAYDLLLAGPALMVLWDRAEEQHEAAGIGALASHTTVTTIGSAAIPVLLFVYSAPILTIALPWLPIQWSVVGFVVLGSAIAFTLMRRGALDGAVRPTRIVHSLTLP